MLLEQVRWTPEQMRIILDNPPTHVRPWIMRRDFRAFTSEQNDPQDFGDDFANEEAIVSAILERPDPLHTPNGPVITFSSVPELHAATSEAPQNARRMISLLILDQSPRHYALDVQVGEKKVTLESGDEEAHIAKLLEQVAQEDTTSLDFFEQVTMNIPEEDLREHGLMLTITFGEWKMVEVEEEEDEE